jgi:hypothetical protein
LANPQKIKFKSICEFLDSLPEEELPIVEALRELVLECIPDCKEKLAYNVPFYYRYSRIVFIWAASVPWGALDKGVALSFFKGTQFFELETEGKKSVGRKVFTSLKQNNQLEIRQLLYEAVLLDEQEHKLKRRD